jgi:hypothetical protein
MGSEISHGCAQNAESGFGFGFPQRYHKNGDELLNHILRGTGSFLNDETKGKSEQWMHTPNKFKHTLSVYQLLIAIVFWNSQSADGNEGPQ